MEFIFCSDLHGNFNHYNQIFTYAKEHNINNIVIGGDLTTKSPELKDIELQKQFLNDKIFPIFDKFSGHVYLIMGNDDYKANHDFVEQSQKNHNFTLFDSKVIPFGNYFLAGYSYVTYSPFEWKDWERRDLASDTKENLSPITRLQGFISDPIQNKVSCNILDTMQDASIEEDLFELCKNVDASKLILVSHVPPFNTNCDCIKPSEQIIHVGSRAVNKFISQKQPLLSLHGHIHETVRISGHFVEKIGNTTCASSGSDWLEDAAHILVINIDNDISINRIKL